MSQAIQPYTIDVPRAALDDLAARLALTRWPERAPVADWSQGTPLEYLREVCEYWASGYDWRAVESRLNAWPQFITRIDGVDLHFLHVRSPEPQARPLVLTHGWPGSVVEFLEVIGPLTDPRSHGGEATQAFHLVIPALPGYGFSGKPTETGWGVQRIARAWDVLMRRLGYARYFAQGGDWGAAVTTSIGVDASSGRAGCAGIHVNMPLVGPDRATLDALTPLEERALAAGEYYQMHDSGYAKQQGTRPQTIGYALVDSPAGLAAWVLEKFHRWMDCDGHPENVASRDRLLDNLMFYWLTAAGASSARLYWESFGRTGREPVSIPSGCSLFPKEIFQASERWVRRRYTGLQYWHELERGGHFAAFEQPALFVDELRACFAGMRLD